MDQEMLTLALVTTSTPTGTERYAHGNSYCHTDGDVAECQAYTYSSSESNS